MSRHHDKWYTRIFSDPKIVEELLRSFVHEDFVKELDFSSLKKLNTKFIPVSEKSRHADVVYEIKSNGQSAYIYLFLEFQSTVDRFMAMRMGRYIFEFYQEIQRLTKSDLLNPPFPILIYNGNAKWDAPDKFSELLHKSSISKEYLPEFKYFKIAINEISKRDLVKIRNAVAAIFYIENSSVVDMTRNWNELVTLLKAVLEKDGIDIIRAIMDRIYQIHNLPENSKTIQRIEDLTEVKSMLETNTKNWEKAVFEKGIEKGIEKRDSELVLKMAQNGMSNSDIRKITGLSLQKIVQITKKSKLHAG
ncbi:MAG TPA: Rpn family recombination-promoting nuclease/putative transposase [Chitinispirillaceae bacterium]|nr:Rpn family recombination-promoting nuclease/putative transposase [Chitinispirillaceae bacterium]